MNRVGLLIASPLLLVSCTTVPRQSSLWCNPEHVQNAVFGEERRDVRRIDIRPSQLRFAYDQLQARNFIILNRETLARLSTEQFQNNLTYVLMRTGVYAGQNVSQRELNDISNGIRARLFQFREIDRLLTIIGFQGVEGVKMHPIPILVAVSFSPASTQSYCYTHY